MQKKLCDWSKQNRHQRTSRDPIGCLKYIQHIHTGHLHHFYGLAQFRSGPFICRQPALKHMSKNEFFKKADSNAVIFCHKIYYIFQNYKMNFLVFLLDDIWNFVSVYWLLKAEIKIYFLKIIMNECLQNY